MSALANRERPARAGRHARPTRCASSGGLVFAYLGPDAGTGAPPLRPLRRRRRAARHRARGDPVQLAPDHGEQRRPGAPRVAARPTTSARCAPRAGQPAPTRYARRHVEIGFDGYEHGIVKRRVLEGGSRDDDDWAIGHPLVFPNMVRVGSDRQHRFQIRVPVDDTHTLHWWYSCYFPAPGAPPVEQDHDPGVRGAVPRRRAASSSTSSTAATS